MSWQFGAFHNPVAAEQSNLAGLDLMIQERVQALDRWSHTPAELTWGIRTLRKESSSRGLILHLFWARGDWQRRGAQREYSLKGNRKAWVTEKIQGMRSKFFTLKTLMMGYVETCLISDSWVEKMKAFLWPFQECYVLYMHAHKLQKAWKVSIPVAMKRDGWWNEESRILKV